MRASLRTLACVAMLTAGTAGGCTLVEGFDRFRAGDAGPGVDGGARDTGVADTGDALDGAMGVDAGDASLVDAGSAMVTVTFGTTGVLSLGGAVVRSADGDIACAPTGGRCSQIVPIGTMVTLTLPPWATASMWEGVSCRAGRSCTFTVSGDVEVTITGAAIGNLAFVTSTTYAPTANEVVTGSQADDECGRVADAAGLPGTFHALFGSGWNEQRARLGDTTLGYVRIDGRVLQRPGASLDPTLTPLVHPLDVDEHGASVPVDLDAVAYTGPAVSCATGLLGSVHAVRGWASNPAISCTDTRFRARLYCFEATTVHAALPEPTRDAAAVYMFVSRPMSDFGIRSLMDTQCQSEAVTAGLPGTYEAFIASPTAGALAHVTRLDAPVLRPDHHTLVAHARDLLTQNPLDTAPVLYADGTEATSLVGTGFLLSSPTDPPGPMQSCSSWMQHVASFSAGVGYPMHAAWPPTSTLTTPTLQDTYARTYGSWTSEASFDCSLMLSAYCIRVD